jgi:lysozyme
MSDIAPLGPHGLRLLRQFEKGPLKVAGVPWPRSPNGCALRAYQCSANKWTVGWGCTLWFDGSKVGPGYVLADEASADKLLEINMRPFLAAVDRLVAVPINPLQRDALACLAMNIGQGAFADSTALRETNNGNFELAAEAFGLFSGATTYSPTSKQISNPEYAGAIGQKDGKWVWVGPQGQACGYMTRLSGLRRRHLSEGLLFKGFDWQEACAEGAVTITLRPPSERMWNARKNRWEDRIKTQTTLADVEYIAERHPLDETELVLFDAQPIEIDPGDMPVGEVELEPVEASTAPSERVEAVTSGPAVAVQPPSAQGPAQKSPASVVPSSAGNGGGEAKVAKEAPAAVQPPPTPVGTKPKSANTVAPAEVPYRINPDAGLKPLDESDRVKGYWYQQFGIVIIRLGSFGVFGTGVASVSQKVQSDAAISNMVLTGFVLVGVAVTGFVIKKYGDWKRKRGEKSAVQALY